MVLNFLCLLPLIIHSNESCARPLYPRAFVRLIILTVGHVLSWFMVHLVHLFHTIYIIKLLIQCGWDWTFVSVGLLFLWNIIRLFIDHRSKKAEEQMKCTYTPSFYSHNSCGFVSLLAIPSHLKNKQGKGKKGQLLWMPEPNF